jgi:hypothetical protein
MGHYSSSHTHPLVSCECVFLPHSSADSVVCAGDWERPPPPLPPPELNIEEGGGGVRRGRGGRGRICRPQIVSGRPLLLFAGKINICDIHVDMGGGRIFLTGRKEAMRQTDRQMEKEVLAEKDCR